MSSIVRSSRPSYSRCQQSKCRAYLLNEDYFYLLIAAGVPERTLSLDMFLDTESCCYQSMISQAPDPDHMNDDEYEDTARLRGVLEGLQSIQLRSPPPFVLGKNRKRPTYLKSTEGLKVSQYFVGAEPYFYLVERGHNPEHVLDHLRIMDSRDRATILAHTDRIEYPNEHYCGTCRRYIPYIEYASYVYRECAPRELLYLGQSDILTGCCRDTAASYYPKGTRNEIEHRRQLVKEAYQEGMIHRGIPIRYVGEKACITCNRAIDYFEDYDWLVHRGVPSAIALNYFGLFELCCRQNVMNPLVEVPQSSQVRQQIAGYEATIEPEPAVTFDYEANALEDL